MLLGWLPLLLAACGLPECRDLCAAEADCIERDLRDFDATWEDWTGFADRDAFEDACFDVFAQSRDEGADRGDLRGVCAEDLREECG